MSNNCVSLWDDSWCDFMWWNEDFNAKTTYLTSLDIGCHLFPVTLSLIAFDAAQKYSFE